MNKEKWSLALILTLFSPVVWAQNVNVVDGAYGQVTTGGTTVISGQQRIYKIDNVAKKKAELAQQQTQESVQKTANEESLSQEQTSQEKTAEENVQPYIGGYKKRSLKEIQENLKLSPQELLEKVRKERQEAKEQAAKGNYSNSEYNEKVTDALKARREERRNMTKEERRAIKEELKMLYKARREERRNMTKEERRAIKEQMKAKEKARREQQKADRKKRRQMRDMD